MRIKLYNTSVVIEASEKSKYINYITHKMSQFSQVSRRGGNYIIPSNEASKSKKELLLKTVYFICVQEVGYQNPIFFEKLMRCGNKKLVFSILDSKYYQNNAEQSAFIDHYEILQSNRFESLNAIRKKYIKLVKQYHPDRVASESKEIIKTYTEKFLLIQQAYEAVKLQKAS